MEDRTRLLLWQVEVPSPLAPPQKQEGMSLVPNKQDPRFPQNPEQLMSRPQEASRNAGEKGGSQAGGETPAAESRALPEAGSQYSVTDAH